MATISNVNGKKITKIKYKGEIFDTGGSGESTLKTLLDATKSTYYLFYNYSGSSIEGLISYSDTGNVTNMNYMFFSCSNLTTFPQLDTSNVSDMSYMCHSCPNFISFPLLNTSKVTNMKYLCYHCPNLATFPQLDTSNVGDMSYMFTGCSNLTTIKLNTSRVTNMYGIFSGCSKLETIDITYMIDSSYNTNSFAKSCKSLTKLIIRTMPRIPYINTNAFTDCYHFTGTVDADYNPQGLKDGRIYVPDDKVEALKTATNWSVYADIIVPLSTLVE